MPYAFGPAVEMEPLFTSELLLPLAAMPSLYAPVVTILPADAFVSRLLSPVPSKTAPRLVPEPPPPVRVSAPLLVIVLDRATLNDTGDPVRVSAAATVESTVTLTPVDPVSAATGATPVPLQTTLVPVGGAVEVHAAFAVPPSAPEKTTALQMPKSTAFFIVSVS